MRGAVATPTFVVPVCMRSVQKGGAGPSGAWLHVGFSLCKHAPRAKRVEQAGGVGGDNRGRGPVWPREFRDP